MDTTWQQVLKDEGITKIECPFSLETIKKWNQILDPHFKKIDFEDRSYATIEDLFDLGIFQDFFSQEMRMILRDIMPDPTILCLHAYEIKGQNDKNHIFSEAFDGWHRDIAELPGLQVNAPNFISLFIYLSEVNAGDGEFEIIKRSFTGPAINGEKSLKVIGQAGTTFIWNRALLHRATPNTSPTRRRVLKLSIQHNYFQNEHIHSPEFIRIRNLVKDPYLRFITGEKHATSPVAHQAPVTGHSLMKVIPLISNSQINIRFTEFLKGLWWFMRKNKRPFGP